MNLIEEKESNTLNTIEILNQNVDRLKIVTTGLQGIVENHGQKHTESKAAMDNLSGKTQGYEQEHAKIEQLINQQSDLYSAHEDTFENHIIEFENLQGKEARSKFPN